jgi:hypothetical protein
MVLVCELCGEHLVLLAEVRKQQVLAPHREQVRLCRLCVRREREPLAPQLAVRLVECGDHLGDLALEARTLCVLHASTHR